MKSTPSIQNAGLSLALRALKLYDDGDFCQAVKPLIEVLDAEPNNWQARLMLGSCYYNTGSFAAAQRAFQFTYEKCADEKLKRQAFEGWQACKLKLDNPASPLPDFGCDKNDKLASNGVAWMREERFQARCSHSAPPVTRNKWSAKLSNSLMAVRKIANPFLLHPQCQG